MAYILTAITGGQTVGQAFTTVNQNLAAIESNSGGDFLPLSGGTLTGNLVITNGNNFKVEDGTAVNSVQINTTSIYFNDDYNAVKTTLQFSPLLFAESVVNIIDTEPDGYMVIVPTPSGEGGKNIRVNASGDAWEYIDLDAKFLALTGGTLTDDLFIDTYLRLYDPTNSTYGYIKLDDSKYYFRDSGGNNISTINQGSINIYDFANAGMYNSIVSNASAITTNTLPNKSGTFAMLSDIKPVDLTTLGTGNRIILSLSAGTTNSILQKSLSGGSNVIISQINDTLLFTTTGLVQNTGDTIQGLYTINENDNGSIIRMIGDVPLIELSGVTGSSLRLIGTDLSSKLSLSQSDINFNINGNSTLLIQPSLTTTGTSTLTIIKLTGNTSGYIPSVSDISTHPNEFIKVNNNGTGFNFGILSGAGTVSVTQSVAGYTIAGSGATTVQSAGTGTINIISSITNNTLVYRTISAGSQMNITQSNGDIIIAANPSEGVLFNSLGNQSVSNSTTETSVIFSSVQGSTTLKASTATTLPQQTAGRRYRFTANGTLQSHSSAGNLIARMKIGSVLLASSTTAMHNSIPASTTLFIDCTFTVRTAGASSNIQSRGIMHITHSNFVSNGSNSAPIATATATAIDTRTDKVFDFTLQFGTANASNTFTINEATLEYLDV